MNTNKVSECAKIKNSKERKNDVIKEG